MAKGGVTQYFEKKKENIEDYNKSINDAILLSNQKVLKGVVSTLAIWDMFMMVNHIAGNKDTGCCTEDYLLTYSEDIKYMGLVMTMHSNRNKLAHLSDNLEKIVSEVSKVVSAYEYYNKLQKDLDMIFAGTVLTLSAKDVFKAYYIQLNTELSDELPELENY